MAGLTLGRRRRPFDLWGFEAVGNAAAFPVRAGVSLWCGFAVPDLEQGSCCNGQCNQDGKPEKGAGTAWGAAPRRFQIRGFPVQVQGELALFARGCRVVARRGAVRISGHGVFLDVPLIRRCTAGEAVPVSGGTGVAR